MSFYRTAGVVNVKAVRDRQGMSREELIRATGLSASTISNCESGGAFYPSVTEATVRALCGALGISKYEITVGPEEANVLREIEREAWASERAAW